MRIVMDKLQFTDEQIVRAYHPANAFAERMACAYHSDDDAERAKHAAAAMKRLGEALTALGYRLEKVREQEHA
jgi:hypothetical protein